MIFSNNSFAYMLVCPFVCLSVCLYIHCLLLCDYCGNAVCFFCHCNCRLFLMHLFLVMWSSDYINILTAFFVFTLVQNVSKENSDHSSFVKILLYSNLMISQQKKLFANVDWRGWLIHYDCNHRNIIFLCQCKWGVIVFAFIYKFKSFFFFFLLFCCCHICNL